MNLVASELRSPSARYIIMYFHCNGADLGMCRGFCNVLRRQFRVHVLLGIGRWSRADICYANPWEEKDVFWTKKEMIET